MKIAVMQPYVFPYIGYFQLIQAVDIFVFYDDVNFIKKGYINKNYILTNGVKSPFKIPCKKISQNKTIKDTFLFFDAKSKLKFLKTIEQAYHRAPFFYEFYPRLKQFILDDSYKTISAFAIGSVQFIADYLSMKCKWIVSSANYADSLSLKKEQRIIHIAKVEGASTYINAIGGIDLYNKKDFEKHQLDLTFIKSSFVEYKQFNHDFVPWLSIIDVLMFNSLIEVQSLLNAYELI